MKIGSKSPRKQRNFVRNLALHLHRNCCSCHLSKELRKEMKKRSVVIRKGDKVKIMRGGNAGKEGKIVGVDYKTSRVFVEKIVRKKSDGKEKQLPIPASNVLVVELDKSDERRFGVSVKTVKKEVVVEEKTVKKKVK